MTCDLRADGFWPRNPLATPPQTVEASGYKRVAGETIPRRHPKAIHALKLQPRPGVATVFDILKHAVVKYADAPAFGSRALLCTHTETKVTQKAGSDGTTQPHEQQWTYYEFDTYRYVSYLDFERLALDVGSGLRKLGLAKHDKISIYAATSLFWFATAHGASSQSMTVVTAYDTLGEEGLRQSLVQTGAKAVFCDPSLLLKLRGPLQDAANVGIVIYNDKQDVEQSDLDELQKAHPRVRIFSFQQLLELGSIDRVEPCPPAPEDLCCVMYTSGSTGPPKGVRIKHSNVVAAIAGIDALMGQYLHRADRFLGYLPLAHIIEFVIENAALYWGATVGYGTPRTLVDTSVRNCQGDLTEFRPTLMLGVPAVWESVKKGILAKVDVSPVKKSVFWAAMEMKSTLLHYGYVNAVKWLDYAIFSAVQKATGGNLLVVMNGGGPICPDTRRFISQTIAPMISGYGLTETSGMGALTDPAAMSYSALGTIPACIEIKLVDLPDLGYLTSHNPPRGEIWIRGGSVSDGYYGLEEETRESFVDGWFKTGDIGQFDRVGRLCIIDRKKNLVKTLHGEYIALEKLESIYRSCSAVANVCVYAAPDKARPIAIVMPAAPGLAAVGSQAGLGADASLEDLCTSLRVQALVLREMQAVARNSGLAGIEIIEGVALTEDEWTPQNGLLTSAQKLNRRDILKKYQHLVDRAYGRVSK